jgi:hypothetical protein
MSRLNKNARYEFTKVDVKHFTIPANVQTFEIENMYMGNVPFRVTMGLVSNEAFIGNYALNPYNFQHFNLCYLCMNVDGRQIPTQPYQLDFSKKKYLRMYESLFHASPDQPDPTLTVSDYANGNCLVTFNLRGEHSINSPVVFELGPEGNVRLSLKFSKTLETSVVILLYAEYQSILEITPSRQIVYWRE